MPMKKLFTTLASRWENGYHFIANNDPNIDIPALAAAGLVYFDRIIEKYISCKYCSAHGEIFWHDFGDGPVCMFGCNESHCRSTHKIDPETIKGWRVNDTVILRSLVESLGMKENITEILADQIWKLGRRQRREYFFIRSVSHDNISQIMAMFGNQPKAVLITTRDADTIKRFMPNVTCFSLCEAGTLDEEYRITFDMELIETYVGDHEKTKKKSKPKRSLLAGKIEVLTQAMKEHVYAAYNYMEHTGQSGEIKLLPRPTQAQLAKMTDLSQQDVSKCLRDPEATILKLFWENSKTMDGIDKLASMFPQK